MARAVTGGARLRGAARGGKGLQGAARGVRWGGAHSMRHSSLLVSQPASRRRCAADMSITPELKMRIWRVAFFVHEPGTLGFGLGLGLGLG